MSHVLRIRFLVLAALAASWSGPASADPVTLSDHQAQAEAGAVLDAIASTGDADEASGPGDPEALAVAVVSSQQGNLGARASGLSRSSFDPELAAFELRASRRGSSEPGGDTTQGSASASLSATQRLVIEGPVRLGFAGSVFASGFTGNLDVTLTNQTTGETLVEPAETSRRLALPGVRPGDVLEFTATGSAMGVSSGSGEERYIHTAFLHLIEPNGRCERGQLSSAQRFCKDTLRCWERWAGGREDDVEREACLATASDRLAAAVQKVLDRAARKEEVCPDPEALTPSRLEQFYEFPIDQLIQASGADFTPAAATAAERKLRSKLLKEAAKGCRVGFAVERRLAAKASADADETRADAMAATTERVSRALERGLSQGVDLTAEISPTEVATHALGFTRERGEAARGGF